MKAVLDSVDKDLFVNMKPVGFVPYYIDKKKMPRVHNKYLSRDIGSLTDTKTVSQKTNLTFMVRQSMGAFLKKLHKFSSLNDATLIYSMWRGYENTAYTKSFLDLCRSLGMRIEYLHASGHAYREQLENAVNCLNPKTLIPIHTENAENFREMHGNVVLLEDGEIWGFTDGSFSTISCRS
jgi:ribonuclease J